MEKNYRYLYLANILREQILSGYIRPGEYIPSEHQLCEQYSLSRTSVRKSLEQLVNEGLIVKKVGAGTMVNPNLVIPPEKSKTMHILVTTPTFFVDNGGFSVIVESFKRLFPNINVRMLKLSTGINFIDAIRRNNELGLHPDIVLAYDSQLRNMEDLSIFADMSDSLRDSLANVYPRLIEGLHFGQGTRLAPVTFSPVFMTYNPDLFESHRVGKPGPDWTREDFLQAAHQLTADTNGDGIPDQYGFSLSTNMSRWMVCPLQNGIVGATGAAYADIVHDTCRFYHELLYLRKGAVMYHANVHAQQADPFVSGRAAMTLGTTYAMSGWNLETMRFVPQLAPLPFGPHKSTLLISNFLLIPETSPNKELAVEFVKTALRPDVQRELGEKTEFLPVLPEVLRQLKPPETLEQLFLTDTLMERHCYLHELFPDIETMDELHREMGLYWIGIDSASSFARKWVRLVPKMEIKKFPAT